MRRLAALSVVAAICLGAGGASRPIPVFAHVVVIVFENKEASSFSAPTFASLGRRYGRLTRYLAVSHPSLPNYLALVSGSTHGVHTDCTKCTMRGMTLGDELTAAGRSWNAYAEGYPSSPRFAKKHVPFLYFPRDVSHVLPLSRFKPTALPAFAFVVPDRCHDMHDCSVATGDAWLRGFVQPLLTLPKTVVFVVFDEGTTNEGGGGHVPALALGTAVRPGVVFAHATNHYGLLRTIEDAWSLPRLGLSAQATPITGIWR
jgi:phosphatidylinositol-3-phosphatase